MKLKSVLGVMLACLVAASCSKHDDGADVLKGEETWVALSLKGKANTYGTDPGDACEQKINRVDIYLFKGDDKSFLSKYSFEASSLDGKRTPAFKSTTALQYMVVLINAPDNLRNAINSKLTLTLSDFESGGTFSTIALANLAELNLYALRTDINDGSFMMVNSGIGTPVTFPVQHDRGVLNPIPIEVERIVARVDVSLDPAAIDFTNPLGAGIVPSDLKFVNEFKVMLDNTNKKSFLFADADQKDPNYAEVATASLTNEFFFITSFPTGFNGVDVPVSSGKGTSNYSTPQYCLENTMEQDYTPTPQKYALEDNATCLILRLRVNKGNTFYMKKDGTLVATDPGTDLKYTYTDGYCYYRVYLRRVGLSIPGSISDVPYGIIRNNLYQIDINTIKGVGSHSIASLKHMPIETGNLIDMDINVKPWTIVKDVIDIP